MVPDREQILRHAPWVCVGLGVVLRVRDWAVDRSLWVDEASLALNILDRPIVGFLEPLAYDQAAPFGFLVLEKLATGVFGAGEPVLRLVPLLAGIAAVPLFWGLARRMLPRGEAVVAVGLFAVSPVLIRYSAEIKPYSLDLALATAVLALSIDALDRVRSRMLVAAAGAVGVWFSFPLVFVLVGVTAAFLLRDALRPDREEGVWRGVLAQGAWVASFGVYYLLSLRAAAGNDYYQSYWRDAFAPVVPSLDTVNWYLTKSVHLSSEIVGLAFVPGVGLLAAVLGAVALARARPLRATLLAAPVAVTLAASAAHRWPFAGRLILFLAPVLVILVARGIGWLAEGPSRDSTLAAAVLGILVLFFPLKSALGDFVSPEGREELEPVLEEVFASRAPDEPIHLYHGAFPAYQYYARRNGWPLPARPGNDTQYPREPLVSDDGSVVVGARTTGSWAAFRERVARMADGTPAAWFVFSHVRRGDVDEEVLFTWFLDGLGTRCETIDRTGASAHLYDFAPEDGRRCA